MAKSDNEVRNFGSESTYIQNEGQNELAKSLSGPEYATKQVKN